MKCHHDNAGIYVFTFTSIGRETEKRFSKGEKGILGRKSKCRQKRKKERAYKNNE
jgi:hypothetical protein